MLFLGRQATIQLRGIALYRQRRHRHSDTRRGKQRDNLMSAEDVCCQASSNKVKADTFLDTGTSADAHITLSRQQCTDTESPWCKHKQKAEQNETNAP